MVDHNQALKPKTSKVVTGLVKTSFFFQTLYKGMRWKDCTLKHVTKHGINLSQT